MIAHLLFSMPVRRGEKVVVPALVLLMLMLGCSAADLVQRGEPTPTPAPTRQPAPTFTPTPENIQPIIIVTPPREGTPGVIIVPPGVDPRSVIPPPPTATPTPTAEPALPPGGESPLATPGQPLPGEQPATFTPTPISLLPTATSTPLATNTPAPTNTPPPTATPYVMVPSGFVSLRTGPGVEYPLVAQLGANIPVAIIGQNPEGTWYQICCVNGESVWVAANSVEVSNNPAAVSLVLSDAPPSPTPTGTATETPTVTPTATSTPYPFERSIGPQFFPTNNEFLTIWVKLYIGLGDPAEGYFLKVLFEGFERPPTNEVRPSFDHFELSAPQGAGNSVEYNLKYEYTPPDPKELDPPDNQKTRAQLLGTGTWTVFVIDGAGNQLSDEVTFTTAPSNLNREVYIGWIRVR